MITQEKNWCSPRAILCFLRIISRAVFVTYLFSALTLHLHSPLTLFLADCFQCSAVTLFVYFIPCSVSVQILNVSIECELHMSRQESVPVGVSKDDMLSKIFQLFYLQQKCFWQGSGWSPMCCINHLLSRGAYFIICIFREEAQFLYIVLAVSQ